MKKNFMFMMTMMMVAMLSIGFTSCGSDDDEDGGNSSYNKLIVGIWKQTHIVIYDADGEIDYENNRESTSVNIFGADGTYTLSDGYNSESAKWSVSGNRLSIKYGRETESYIINSLTENSMILQYDEYGDGRVEVTTYRKIQEETEEE